MLLYLCFIGENMFDKIYLNTKEVSRVEGNTVFVTATVKRDVRPGTERKEAIMAQVRDELVQIKGLDKDTVEIISVEPDESSADYVYVGESKIENVNPDTIRKIKELEAISRRKESMISEIDASINQLVLIKKTFRPSIKNITFL